MPCPCSSHHFHVFTRSQRPVGLACLFHTFTFCRGQWMPPQPSCLLWWSPASTPFFASLPCVSNPTNVGFYYALKLHLSSNKMSHSFCWLYNDGNGDGCQYKIRNETKPPSKHHRFIVFDTCVCGLCRQQENREGHSHSNVDWRQTHKPATQPLSSNSHEPP